MGHYANKCPNADKMDQQGGRSAANLLMEGIAGESDDEDITFNFVQHDVVLSTPHQELIPSNWILLDNQSTVDVFANKKLLVDVHTTRNTLRIRSTGGVSTTNQQGTLPGYGLVWYYGDGIANILSLSNVQRKYRVTYDSTGSNQFVVHKPDGTTRIFRQSKTGLFYHSVKERGGSKATVLVKTVADAREGYTDREFQRAEAARRLQNVIGSPSTAGLLRICLLYTSPSPRDQRGSRMPSSA